LRQALILPTTDIGRDGICRIHIDATLKLAQAIKTGRSSLGRPQHPSMTCRRSARHLAPEGIIGRESPAARSTRASLD